MMKFIRIGILLLAMSSGYAQVFKTDFEYLNTADGLAQNHVFCVSQDSDGFMWFGTMGGLSKYDGFQFTNYQRKDDSTSLSGNFVNRFFQDSKGRCWVTTTTGFNEMDRRSGKFRRYYHNREDILSIGDNNTHGIAEDKDGYLWIVHNKGVDRFDPESNSFQHFFHDGFKVDRHTGDILIALDGAIWVVGTKGVFRVNSSAGSLDFVGVPEIRSDVQLVGKSIFQDSYGNIWVGFNRCLALFDPLTSLFQVIDAPELRKDILHILEYPRGFIALGTAGNGLVMLNIETKQVVNNFNYSPDNPDGIKGAWIYSLGVDSENNLWLGLFYGLNRINLFNQRFGLLQNARGINNYANFTLLVHQDSMGGYWINTMDGLFYRRKLNDPSKRILPTPMFAEGFNDVSAITSDSKGRVYLDVHLNGLYEYSYNSGKFRKLIGAEKLKDRYSPRMRTDVKDVNILWISRPEGFCKVDKSNPDTVWVYPTMLDTSIKSDNPGRFTQDPDGNIYFISAGKLCVYNPHAKSFRMVEPPSNFRGTPTSLVYAKGILWIASSGNTFKFNTQNREWNQIFHEDGTSPLGCSGLQVDDNGWAWAILGNDVVRISPDGVLKNRFLSPTGSVFGIGDKGKDGHLLFGGSNGALFVNPNDLFMDTVPPRAIFSGLEIANKPYQTNNEPEYIERLNLRYADKVFTFKYAALHFTNRHSIKFRYRLEGFDKEWIEAGTRRQVTYTNLRPGKYAFLVEATSEDGLVSAPPLRIEINVEAPFYMTTFFYGLIVILILVLVYFYYSINKRATELSRQRDLAEQNAHYKTTFMANMSHEIRTPMNAIMGLNQLLLDTPLDDKQNEYVNAIKTSSENLLWIINDILDQAKIESGRYSINLKPFEPEIIISQLETLYGYKAKEKNLGFEINIVGFLPVVLIGDQVRLFQILTNLIGNAIKFTDEGNIKINVVSEFINEDDLIIHFEVNDTGYGIPQDQQALIFESFHQLQSKIGAGNQGTGLGLSIVKSLVEQLQGSIRIESEPGKGSTFIVTLPFKIGKENKEVSLVTKNRNLPSGLNILLVEDTPFNQLLAKELLQKYLDDVKIDIAENGKIALEKVQNKLYDLILMDVKMPVMDGLEASKKIRELDGSFYKEIPIIGLTANAIPQQIDSCLKIGMNACVTKPIQPDELFDCIEKYLQDD